MGTVLAPGGEPEPEDCACSAPGLSQGPSCIRRDPMPDPGVHPPLMPCRSGRPRGPSGDWPRKPVPLALLVEWPCHTLGSQVTIHADCVVRRHLPVFLWLLPGGCATNCAGPLLPAPSTQAWVVAALTTLLAPMGTHLRHGPAV